MKFSAVFKVHPEVIKMYNAYSKSVNDDVGMFNIKIMVVIDKKTDQVVDQAYVIHCKTPFWHFVQNMLRDKSYRENCRIGWI